MIARLERPASEECRATRSKALLCMSFTCRDRLAFEIFILHELPLVKFMNRIDIDTRSTVRMNFVLRARERETWSSQVTDFDS